MPLKDFVWHSPFVGETKTYNVFRFKHVTVVEVRRYLKKLSRKKACGVDNLPPGYLKDVSDILANPLCHLINICLRNGTVPNEFKIGKITPIFKSGSKFLMDNYRPISVLPICSKILEKCVHRQLTLFLEEKRLLNDKQFGFRKHRNTEQAATLFVDSIRKNMNTGKMTGAIFIDLSKAFDTLSHGQIIANLTRYGITGVEKELFSDYLFNRKQQVNYIGEQSPFKSVTCGVPQGSILGPLLFLVSFNDVGDSLQFCEIFMFADDTVIFASGTSVDEIDKALSTDFNIIADWMAENELLINMKRGKTESMLFGTRQKIKNKSLEITYKDQEINHTTSYKYLGVKLDQTVLLNDHLNSTYKKAAGRLYLLNRLRNQLNIKAALTIYTSLILPLFTYCSIITCNSTNTYKKKLKNMESRAQKIISKSNDVKLPCIEDIMTKKLSLEVFKIINGITIENFNGYFETIDTNTRNKNILLRLPKTKLESFKKSFSFYGAKVFNNLPRHVRSANSIENFLSNFN